MDECLIALGKEVFSRGPHWTPKPVILYNVRWLVVQARHGSDAASPLISERKISVQEI